MKKNSGVSWKTVETKRLNFRSVIAKERGGKGEGWRGEGGGEGGRVGGNKRCERRGESVGRTLPLGEGGRKVIRCLVNLVE